MTSQAAPLNKIHCEYRTLEELVDALNRTLYWRRVVLSMHEVNGYGSDRMKAGFGAIYSIALEQVPVVDDVRIAIHVHGYGYIHLRNTPLVVDGVEYPSEIYIEGDHVSLRHAYTVGDYDCRRVVKVYHVISALASLDD